jgi:hypothetical protein
MLHGLRIFQFKHTMFTALLSSPEVPGITNQTTANLSQLNVSVIKQVIEMHHNPHILIDL